MATTETDSLLLVASKDWTSDGAETAKRQPGGLVTYARDAESGLLGSLIRVDPLPAPSYTAYNPVRSVLYVTSDFSNTAGSTGGSVAMGRVSALRVHPSGRLEFLNDQLTGGWVPCHVAVHQRGLHVLSADYGNGTVAVYPLREDGGLEPASHLVRNEGSGPNKHRQAGPHAHMVRPAPEGAWLLVTDLGTDEIVAYTLDEESGQLRRRPGDAARGTAGSGPRHLVFHGTHRVFVVNELRSTVTVFSYEPTTAALTMLREAPTISGEDPGELNAPSGLVLSPDERFLYVGNRGHDTISVLRVEGDRLSLVEEVSSGGEPRELTFVDGILYVANLTSHTVSVFRHDPASGLLDGPRQVVQVPSPSCVLGLPATPVGGRRGALQQ
jgi:6-phosphogluconolactonase (cycloisomerase 2 family)